MSSNPSEVLRAHRLGVTYHRGPLWGSGVSVQALDDVDLGLASGEIVGVVGPSGSGKSTLARCLTLREAPSQGRLEVLGVDAWQLPAARRHTLRPNIQLVDQSPAAALDPRFTVERALSQPLRYRAAPGVPRLDPVALGARVHELLRTVDLEPDLGRRPCHTLSGGQKQRVVIARALAAEPRVLIFDEPLAALDAYQHHRLLHLLKDLHRRHSLTYVWISHDLQTVVDFVQRVLVMDHGKVVEEGTSRQLWQEPRHAVSRALVEASLDSAPRLAPQEATP